MIAVPWASPRGAPTWLRRFVDWLRPSYASIAFAGLWVFASLARFGWYTHGFRLRLSEAAGLLIMAGMLVVARFRIAVPWPGALFPLAYVAMETLSTLVNPADWARGFKLDILLGAEAVLALGAAALVSAIDVRTVARTIVAAGGLAASVAIGLTLLYQLHLTGFGVQVDPVTGLCKTYGTMYEANLLGSYLAAALVFSLAVGPFLGPAWFSYGCRGLMVVAVGLTLTRAVWFAAFVGALALLALAVDQRLRLRKAQVAGIAVGAGLALFTGIFLIQTATSHPCGPARASELSTQGSISGRLASNVLALKEWAQAPFLGLGTGSTRVRLPNDPNQPWISSQAVATLHDTGVIGSVLVDGMVLLLLWALVRWHRPAAGSGRSIRYGLAAAMVTLLVAFQATTGTLMEYPWLFIGTSIGVLYARRSSVEMAGAQATARAV